jgi:hypothetical protein
MIDQIRANIIPTHNVGPISQNQARNGIVPAFASSRSMKKFGVLSQCKKATIP